MTDAISRRRFLRQSVQTAVAAAFPAIVPSSVLGRGKPPPSDRIGIACIGVGWMGTSNLNGFLNEPDTRVLAVCDIDQDHLAEARRRVNDKYGDQDCAVYHDFRECLQHPDVDAVSLALPDHWHAIPAIAAARAGKDIYSEKPLSHSLVEGRAMCEAVSRYGRIWQTGSWQRSVSNFRIACELVLNGRIGEVRSVEVGLPAGHSDFGGTKGQETMGPPPAQLDYDLWLGPAPYEPYCPARVHKNWRWHLDYGGGQLMDWVGHHVDIAHWGLGLDTSGPIEIAGYGEYPKTGLWNTATRYRLKARYAGGIEMTIAGGHGDIRSGTKWIGDEGWVWVNRGGLEAEPASLLDETIGPNEINLRRVESHYRDFLDCVRTRQTTLTPCEIAHRSATPGHLGQIAMRLGRRLRFDPKTEAIIGDEVATRMLGSPMRSPWHL